MDKREYYQLSFEEVIKITEDYESGLTVEQICEKYNINCDALYYWLNIFKRKEKQNETKKEEKQNNQEQEKQNNQKENNLLNIENNDLNTKNNTISEAKNNYITPEKAYILGALAGDGSINLNGISCHCGIDEDFTEAFCKCVKKAYNYKPRIKILYNNKGQINNYICHIYGNIYNEKFIINDILKYSDIGRFNWKVPDEIINGNETVKSYWLRGFFDAEGCVSYDGKRKNIVVVSVNKKEMIKVAQLLKDLEIKFNIYFHKRKKKSHSDVTVIRISNDFYNIKRFAEKVGFSINRKQQKLIDILNNYVERDELILQILKDFINNITIDEISTKYNIPNIFVSIIILLYLKTKNIPMVLL